MVNIRSNDIATHISPPIEDGAKFRRAQVIIFLLLISVFGPYLLPNIGVRIEHIVIYTLLIGFILKLIMDKKQSLSSVLWSLLFLWGASVLWISVVTIFLKQYSSTFRAFAALENLLQPIALMIVIGVVLSHISSQGRLQLLINAIQWMIVLLILNTLISIATIYFDTWPLVNWFVREDMGGSSVWLKAASMGRYSGIFDQPAEAGIAYSVSLLGWVYLTVGRYRLTWRQCIAGIMLIMGGLLSVSKIFILGGLPIALGYAVWLAGYRYLARTVTLFLGIIVGVLVMVKRWEWLGWNFLMRLFNIQQFSDEGLLYLYTAGRFGGKESTVKQMFEETWNSAFLHGFGLGTFSSLDNGYLEFFYQGGIIALLLYGIILCVIGFAAFQASFNRLKEGKLLIVLWIIIVGAGLGAPVFTSNRSSILLWVILIIALHVIQPTLSRQKKASLPPQDDPV